MMDLAMVVILFASSTDGAVCRMVQQTGRYKQHRR